MSRRNQNLKAFKCAQRRLLPCNQRIEAPRPMSPHATREHRGWHLVPAVATKFTAPHRGAAPKASAPASTLWSRARRSIAAHSLSRLHPRPWSFNFSLSQFGRCAPWCSLSPSAYSLASSHPAQRRTQLCVCVWLGACWRAPTHRKYPPLKVKWCPFTIKSIPTLFAMRKQAKTLVLQILA